MPLYISLFCHVTIVTVGPERRALTASRLGATVEALR
jgi:hypothetical protein